MRRTVVGLWGLLKVLSGRLEFPTSLSVDVTYRCNLRCRHCYFLKAKYKQELPLEEFIERIKEVRREYNLYNCAWLGGEPLLRKELIERGKALFHYNWIITNGTIELPEWKDCTFFVSVDGTKKEHEKIRGRGTYDKIKENITRSGNKIYIAAVLNSENYGSAEDMVREWGETNVKGINFDFHTPIRRGDELFINPEKRDEILANMLRLKDEYGNFILLTDKIIELMRSDNYGKVVGENCIQRKVTRSLDPMGRIKEPCVMGNVDCQNCGCIITYAINASVNRDLRTLKMMFGKMR
jgi:sulfatase maturation enzyme AslB (radical SAM superfamily)